MAPAARGGLVDRGRPGRGSTAPHVWLDDMQQRVAVTGTPMS